MVGQESCLNNPESQTIAVGGGMLQLMFAMTLNS